MGTIRIIIIQISRISTFASTRKGWMNGSLGKEKTQVFLCLKSHGIKLVFQCPNSDLYTIFWKRFFAMGLQMSDGKL